jgi:hypothetical protein
MLTREREANAIFDIVSKCVGHTVLERLYKYKIKLNINLFYNSAV